MGPTLYSNETGQSQAQGSVPSAQSGGGSANPVLDSLGEAIKHAQAQVESAAKQVQNTPMYSKESSAQPQMPVQKPIPGGGASVNNLNNVHPETAAGARAKGIGQIAAQAGHFVNTFMKKKQEEKTQALAQDVNRVLELQKGVDEANQVIAQDPNNAQAKATLQKNNTLLGSILNGKNGKDIAKAFDVTMGEGAKDEKNKNAPEKKAMSDAMRQHQEDEKREQFQSQQPSRMAANPAYDTAMRNLQATQKQANDLAKTYTTMASKVMTEQGASERAAATDASRERIATGNQEKAVEVQKLKGQEEEQKIREQHKNRMAEIGAQGANRINAIKTAKALTDGGNAKGMKLAEDWAKSVSSQIDKTEAGITKIDTELNKPENKQSENSGAAKALGESKKMLQDQLKQLQDQRNQAILEMHGDPDAAAVYSLIGQDDDQ